MTSIVFFAFAISFCLGIFSNPSPNRKLSNTFATNRIHRVEQEESQAPKGGVDIERAFPKLRFDRPVWIGGCGDGSGRLFVVEQAGVIRVFDIAEHQVDPDKPDDQQGTATSSVFLDIRDRVSRKGNEEGLIGLAFDPDFKNNRQFYVHYSSSKKDMHGIVSRFQLDRNNRNLADADSEQVILEQKQPYRNHNGGTIAFGPDGYLYISFGDGGSANDPHGNGQDLTNWLGKILRVDVGKGSNDKNYSVPEDNPFLANETARPEIWALGLRNVWRFSFDRKTGQLWAGDVGQNKWEEVDLIKKGGNYGWNRHEAKTIFNAKTKLASENHQGPVAVYARQWGWSITGGHVYRGKKHPQLAGKYFYGDYVSGNLWQIRKTDKGSYESSLVRRTGRSIASFGLDDEGELYLASFDGGIYRVVPSSKPENTFANWKQLLSETGLYESTAKRKIAKHLIPYEINMPFWSDGATKNRFIELPEGKKISYRKDGAWELPIGSVIVKNFEGQHLRGKRLLETRLIKRTKDGWEAATYVWNPRGTDAELKPGGQQFELYQPDPETRKWNVHSWHAPSASECSSCHVDAAGYVLGLNTLQLNRDLGDSGKNQIETWAEKGWLDLPDGFSHKRAERFPDANAKNESLDRMARAWLDVNCSMCHRPNGPGNANIDLRATVKLELTNMVNQKPAQGNLGMKDPMLIKPGHPEHSMLIHRIQTLGEGRMPSVATNQVDRDAVKLLSKWIKEMKQD